MEVLDYRLDRSSAVPLYQQLYEYIADGIRSGKLSPDERLPSRRALTESLRVSANTVTAAYQLLEKDGYILARPASGFYVRPDNMLFSDLNETGAAEEEYQYNFSSNTVELSKVPKKKLAVIYRDALYDQEDLFSHGEKMGDRCLRRAVAKYLFAVRGVRCSERQIVIGAGRDYLLMCLCRMLGLDRSYGIENPCYARSYFAIRDSRVPLTVLNIGLGGLRPEQVREASLDVLYLMPNHQYPNAYIMDEPTRLSLLNWAAERGAYLIEDDYDGEFLFTRDQPRPLFSLDKSERVIFLGDFERAIAPGIKIAYLVLPKPLAESWVSTLPYYYTFASRAEQFALSRLIEEGHAARQAKNLAHIYRQKRDALIRALGELPFADRLTLSGTGGGTHFLVRYDCGADDQELRAAAKREGIKLIPLSACLYRGSSLLPDRTMIFGYGGLSGEQIQEGIRRLSRAWEGL